MPEEAPAERSAAHLTAAIRTIDAAFGEGYAAANPSLVAAFLQSASIESAVLSGDRAAAMLDATAVRSIDKLCVTLEYLKPRFF